MPDLYNILSDLNTMDYFDSNAVKNALPYPQLIEALTQGLQLPIEVPPRSFFCAQCGCQLCSDHASLEG